MVFAVHVHHRQESVEKLDALAVFNDAGREHAIDVVDA